MSNQLNRFPASPGDIDIMKLAEDVKREESRARGRAVGREFRYWVDLVARIGGFLFVLQLVQQAFGSGALVIFLFLLFVTAILFSSEE